MKEFSYYETPNAPYFGYDYGFDFKDKRTREINEQRLTAAERETALRNLSDEVKSHMLEVNRPRNEEVRALRDEFWQDARAELGYAKILTEKGISKLESTAYSLSPSSSFMDIFGTLATLSELFVALFNDRNVQEK